MDIKDFVVRIGRFLPEWTIFVVPVRVVDGGLACNGSGSALNSPGVVALIGYPVAFPSPFSRPKRIPEKPKKRSGTNSIWERIWCKSRRVQASCNTRQGYERGHEPCRHIGVQCVASRQISTVPLNGPDCPSGSRAPRIDLVLLKYFSSHLHEISFSLYFGSNLAALDL